MTKEQIYELIDKRIAGQGNQLDTGGVVASVLRGIVELITSVDGKIGDLSELDTDHKSDIVEAINELADIAETAELVVSMTQRVEERKAIYDLCSLHPQLAKNVVVEGSDGLYYPVNGYGFVNGALHLHTIFADTEGVRDVVLKIASNGSILV